MSDFTATWHWPQWTVLALLFIKFGLNSMRHGEERIERTGERKGMPERYNGFTALSSFVIWTAVLICGGFFA